MRRWLPHLAAICLMALPAQARDIAVRSGEHDGFTRLVVYLDQQDSFDISNTDDGYLLALSSGVTDFDLSRAFDLIDRTRIQDLSTTDGIELSIQRGCDCHLKEFRLSTGELVIDIIDGPDPDSRPKPEPISVSNASAIPVEQQRASLPLFNPPEETSELTDAREEPSEDALAKVSDSANETPKVDRQALLTQLSRAASQGLIEANITPPDIPQITAPPDTEEEKLTPTPHHTPEQHVRMQTAVEQARAGQSGANHSTDTSNTCLPDEQFDIARWGTYTTHTNAPVFETSSYLGEFDRPNAALLVSHIRQQIYMTFGLEALQLLENYGDNLGDGAILRMMAEVVEYGEAKSHADFASQLLCNTRGALWAALAQPSLQERLNINAALRSFSELPPHLRTHLAPILARKLLNSGRVDAAIEVRNIAARSGHPKSGEAAILDARINLENGHTEKAEQELSDTVHTALTQTQPAISALIEAKLREGTGISDKELTLLTSVAFEHQGSKEGAALRQLQIRALLHMGRFASAFSEMDGLSSGTDHDELLEEAGHYLVTLGSDAEFLTYSLARGDWGNTSAAMRLKIAERLSALGFHEQARRHVLSNTDAPSRSAREFLAKLALLQNKPKVAFGYLAGLNSDTALSLQEAAMRQSAMPEIDANAESIARSSSEILHGLNTTEHPIPASIQTVLASERLMPPLSIDTDLGTYQGILDDSDEIRTALGELLEIIPPVDGSK